MVKQKAICPNCNSENIIKKGLRKSKLQTTQRYYCKNCTALFTENIEKDLKNKTYSSKIILRAISLYNLGYTQQNISQIISRRYKTKTPQKNNKSMDQ